MKQIIRIAASTAVLFSALCAGAPHAADPLPSWREGAAKQAIIDFVQDTTRKVSPDFVPVSERVAVFDNDGTLWSEQPMYFQAFFIFDRIKALGAVSVRTLAGIQETVKFPLPKGLRQD